MSRGPSTRSQVAQIDRRIEVIEGDSEQLSSVHRVSDLRSLPYIVVLGEPGIGKSTVFAAEAEHEGVPVLKARGLMTGGRPVTEGTLFLDALDEYRREGQAADRVHSLGEAMARANARRWRLSCRSEDWRKEADTIAIQRATDGLPIVIARLLPLDRLEASAVLAARGEADPSAFLDRAEGLGASGFTENPLSLVLLHAAVASGGAWPSTRFELFESAIKRLAHEFDTDHKYSQRSPWTDIVDAAAKVCALVLLSGARAIWRPNDLPPDGLKGASEYLTVGDLQIEDALLGDMLDTPLFRGDGEAFEPVHRTVAEFLAAQHLATVVSGVGGKSALPVSRAIALVAGFDGEAPTELRGVYAWLAAHLARLGCDFGAKSLIERDAATVLLYGDAAAFSTPSRRLILQNLERRDPYFRAVESGVTAVGGLAGEDLGTEFTAILMAPGGREHTLLTVLEALTVGRPVLSLRPLLREMALDSTRQGWLRWRAADAWLNGESDQIGARRELFDALVGEPTSAGREELRVHLAADLPASRLSLEDLKSILSDFQCLGEHQAIGSLFALGRKLEGELRNELFEEPVSDWLPRGHHPYNRMEVDDLLDRVLAASIRGTPELPADRLWGWLRNLPNADSSPSGREATRAIGEWIDVRSDREISLLDAILADDNSTALAWKVVRNFTLVARRVPSSALIGHLLGNVGESEGAFANKRLLEVAVDLACLPGVDPEVYWQVYDRLAGRFDYEALLKRLTISPIESWRWEQYHHKTQAQRKKTKIKAVSVERLAPLLAELRAGKRVGSLAWAARLYLGQPYGDHQRIPGVEGIMEYSDDVTAEALLAGCEHLALEGFHDVDSAFLGERAAKNETCHVEVAAIAGLDHLLETGRLANQAMIPLVVAIAVLKSSWHVCDNTRRARLESAAIARLNADAAVGAGELLRFWHSALDAGATQLDILGRLSEPDADGSGTALALERLLDGSRTIPTPALRIAVRAAAKHVASERLLALADAALGDERIVAEQRAVWGVLAFALDPVGHAPGFQGAEGAREFAICLADTRGDGLDGLLDMGAGGDRASREGSIVRILGAFSDPGMEWADGPRDWTGEASGKVRRAISWLAEGSCSESGEILADLIAEPSLAVWRSSLRHAAANCLRVQRDACFKHPGLNEIRAALSGGPPVNACDLRAVVMEELKRLRAELRTSDVTPWKRYWNVGSHGEATKPLVENECRDHLLERLRDRLAPYRIAGALPETRRGEGTRADMLILSGAGRNLPLEAKRHFHPDIWVAAATQLQGYAADVGADGFGIYLVLWFGNDVRSTPARPNGQVGPTTAEELEAMLRAELPSEIQEHTEVVVFDVSKPATQNIPKAVRRRKRSKTSPV